MLKDGDGIESDLSSDLSANSHSLSTFIASLAGKFGWFVVFVAITLSLTLYVQYFFATMKPNASSCSGSLKEHQTDVEIFSIQNHGFIDVADKVPVTVHSLTVSTFEAESIPTTVPVSGAALPYTDFSDAITTGTSLILPNLVISHSLISITNIFFFC